jgi:hypothetical protein
MFLFGTLVRCAAGSTHLKSAGNNLCTERLLPVGVALWQCVQAMGIAQAEFDGGTGTVVLNCIQGINTLVAEALPTWNDQPDAFWLACGERTSSVGYMSVKYSCTSCIV